MALGPGTRLGSYEVTALIGQGGMGEVYRARDTKLDRDVALKILPDAFAADLDRLARFNSNWFEELQANRQVNERSYGSVRGVPGNWYPYRERTWPSLQHAGRRARHVAPAPLPHSPLAALVW